jgi:hypothetical protein
VHVLKIIDMPHASTVHQYTARPVPMRELGI